MSSLDTRQLVVVCPIENLVVVASEFDGSTAREREKFDEGEAITSCSTSSGAVGRGHAAASGRDLVDEGEGLAR